MGTARCAGKSDTPIPEAGTDGGADPNDLSAPGTYEPDDPGGGPYDPATGLREWYRIEPEKLKRARVERTITDCLHHWGDIELDLQDLGIDIESGVLQARTWRWLRLRIQGLAAEPSTRLHKALQKGV